MSREFWQHIYSGERFAVETDAEGDVVRAAADAVYYKDMTAAYLADVEMTAEGAQTEEGNPFFDPRQFRTVREDEYYTA